MKRLVIAEASEETFVAVALQPLHGSVGFERLRYETLWWIHVVLDTVQEYGSQLADVNAHLSITSSFRTYPTINHGT
jgi:hypothetical protein